MSLSRRPRHIALGLLTMVALQFPLLSHAQPVARAVPSEAWTVLMTRLWEAFSQALGELGASPDKEGCMMDPGGHPICNGVAPQPPGTVLLAQPELADMDKAGG